MDLHDRRQLQRLLPGLFRGLLPESVELAISAAAVLEGLFLGLLVVTLFTFLPLYRLKEVRPRAIFGSSQIFRVVVFFISFYQVFDFFGGSLIVDGGFSFFYLIGYLCLIRSGEFDIIIEGFVAELFVPSSRASLKQ